MLDLGKLPVLLFFVRIANKYSQRYGGPAIDMVGLHICPAFWQGLGCAIFEAGVGTSYRIFRVITVVSVVLGACLYDWCGFFPWYVGIIVSTLGVIGNVYFVDHLNPVEYPRMVLRSMLVISWIFGLLYAVFAVVALILAAFVAVTIGLPALIMTLLRMRRHNTIGWLDFVSLFEDSFHKVGFIVVAALIAVLLLAFLAYCVYEVLINWSLLGWAFLGLVGIIAVCIAGGVAVAGIAYVFLSLLDWVVESRFVKWLKVCWMILYNIICPAYTD